jgi:hypothetical protein
VWIKFPYKESLAKGNEKLLSGRTNAYDITQWIDIYLQRWKRTNTIFNQTCTICNTS